MNVRGFQAAVRKSRRWLTSAAIFRNSELRRLCPNADMLGDTNNIRKSSALKRIPELRRISVSGICDNKSVWNAPAPSLVDNVDRKFPFRFKEHILGNTGFFPPFSVIGPTLGQIKSPAQGNGLPGRIPPPKAKARSAKAFYGTAGATIQECGALGNRGHWRAKC